MERSPFLDTEDVETETILEEVALEAPFSWSPTNSMCTIQPLSSMLLEEEEEIPNPKDQLKLNALELRLVELAMIAEEVEVVASFTFWPQLEITEP